MTAGTSRAELRRRSAEAEPSLASRATPSDTESATTESATTEPATIEPTSTAAPVTRRSRRAPAESNTSPDTSPDTATPTFTSPDTATTTFTAPDTATTTFTAPNTTAPVDEFELAARLFSFTGETPIQRTADSPATQAEASAVHSVERGARNKRGSAFRRMATASFSVGVMGLVGLLAVGMTTPAAAVAAANGTIVPASVVAPAGDVAGAGGQIQAYVAPEQMQNVAIQRTDTFETATLVQMAGAIGITQPSNSVFTNNPNCPIQWPFAVGVGMSYGFGMRDGTMHEGIDFTPGDGAHIQAIDHGVVRISTDSGGNYGVTIVIDHIVDGQLVSSRYAHMQYGSRQVQVGDTVEVGEYIGRTGDTGFSFGSHTHFEILAGGTTAIDPLPWLRQHTVC